MRKLTATTLLTLALFLTGCGGDTHESLANETVGLLNEFATVLEGVNDEASAKAAAPKLEAIGTKLSEMKKRVDALPKLSEAENKALEEKMQKEMGTFMGKMMGAAMKLAEKPEVQKILEEPMKKFQNSMK